MADKNKNQLDSQANSEENDDELEQNSSENEDNELAVNSELKDNNNEEDEVGDDKKEADSSIAISKSKMALIRQLLTNIKDNNDRLIQLLSGLISKEDEVNISIGQLDNEKLEVGDEEMVGGRIIEGVFDGENMIGPDSKQYSVPVNYASKSKLVEGDILKLTITANGTFVYKQIGPIERSRVVGTLEQTSNGDYYAVTDGKKWHLLKASVTYYRGEPDDEVVVLVPKAGESKWAAVDNIVKKK